MDIATFSFYKFMTNSARGLGSYWHPQDDSLPLFRPAHTPQTSNWSRNSRTHLCVLYELSWMIFFYFGRISFLLEKQISPKILIFHFLCQDLRKHLNFFFSLRSYELQILCLCCFRFHWTTLRFLYSWVGGEMGIRNT